MTTIVCGTNRHDAMTHVVFQKIAEIHEEVGQEDGQFLIDLHRIDFSLEGHQYDSAGQSEGLRRLQDDIVIPSDKLIFVIPEYNGSFPGVLKTFIDALSIRKYKETFSGKKNPADWLCNGSGRKYSRTGSPNRYHDAHGIGSLP